MLTCAVASSGREGPAALLVTVTTRGRRWASGRFSRDLLGERDRLTGLVGEQDTEGGDVVDAPTLVDPVQRAQHHGGWT